jgi:uncharacterized protein YjbJ (UPF0337 family)
MNNDRDMKDRGNMGGVPNRDVLMGKWKQFRGRVREEWGKLTDNQIDQINGDYDRLIGVLQENYGYTREKAMQEADRFITNLDRGGRDTFGNP